MGRRFVRSICVPARTRNPRADAGVDRVCGGQDRQEAVVARTAAAEPHHSPTWQSVAKDLANAGAGTEGVLKMVAARL
jgi:hypothetical protein